MPSGLDALAKTLSDDNLSLVRDLFSINSDECLAKLGGKDFPNGYLDRCEQPDAPFSN